MDSATNTPLLSKEDIFINPSMSMLLVCDERLSSTRNNAEDTDDEDDGVNPRETTRETFFRHGRGFYNTGAGCEAFAEKIMENNIIEQYACGFAPEIYNIHQKWRRIPKAFVH